MVFLSFSDQATLPLSELAVRSVSDLASRSNADGASLSFLDETNWQDHQFKIWHTKPNQCEANRIFGFGHVISF